MVRCPAYPDPCRYYHNHHTHSEAYGDPYANAQAHTQHICMRRPGQRTDGIRVQAAEGAEGRGADSHASRVSESGRGYAERAEAGDGNQHHRRPAHRDRSQHQRRFL